jgi:predicted transcriptional regulator
MPTSLKLSPKLKARIAAVVKGTGQSPHAFMLEAIEQRTSEREKRKQFMADALEAEREFLKTGLYYDAREVHADLEARLQGKKPRPLKARSWRK